MGNDHGTIFVLFHTTSRTGRHKKCQWFCTEFLDMCTCVRKTLVGNMTW
jgi:hypothetical protein